MYSLKINGSNRQFPNGVPGSIDDLLKELKIEASTIVAEVDGKIVERERFGETKLANGQEIELVKFMGGG